MNRLYRSRKNKMIAGVAAGMAEYFEVDVTLVRLLWVLSVMLGGSGILVYIIAAVVIPVENDRPDIPVEGVQEAQGEPTAGYQSPGEKKGLHVDSEKRRRNAGLLLIGLGIIFLVGQTVPHYFLRFSWPLLIIALGIYILFQGSGKERDR
ncbi:DNA-binding transcriptional activator PspC [Pelotomaculum schinkii]|uniref:DNA-binding transcriptional activator PspC n=1 Tax=Pelotomaculum schinkii TaxID=78350 RepID=A0A4Y7RF07_9FIRM|nr:PspC domain-containing protein [Pelotomaculum schinkii]TEB07588.1 DNA-binding transcriptional activator PspC [Pelotomaculum schinkii]